MKRFIASLISAVILMTTLLFQSPAMALASSSSPVSGERGVATSQVETVSQQGDDKAQDTIGSITGEGGQKGKQSEAKAKAAGKTVDRNTKELVANDNKMVNKAVN
ncbi:hypothetical protein KBZ19_02360 [Synechococcus sp. L2F]|nr:hypothetical protein [Synechococcus sp. L2F]